MRYSRDKKTGSIAFETTPSAGTTLAPVSGVIIQEDSWDDLTPIIVPIPDMSRPGKSDEAPRMTMQEYASKQQEMIRLFEARHNAIGSRLDELRIECAEMDERLAKLEGAEFVDYVEFRHTTTTELKAAKIDSRRGIRVLIVLVGIATGSASGIGYKLIQMGDAQGSARAERERERAEHLRYEAAINQLNQRLMTVVPSVPSATKGQTP